MSSNYAPSENEVLNKLFNSIIDDKLFLKNKNYPQLKEFVVMVDEPKSNSYYSQDLDAIYIYMFNHKACVSLTGKNAPLVRLDVIELAHKYGAKFRCLSKIGFRWQGQIAYRVVNGSRTDFSEVSPDLY